MKSTLNTVSLAYAGQRRSAVSGMYLLGNGYRGFNPIIRRFCAWDTASPFGSGGVHGYGYCSGDPANQTDPSGHGPVLNLLVSLGLAVGRNARRAGVADAGAAAGEAAADAGAEIGADAVAESRTFTFYRQDGRSMEELNEAGGFQAFAELDSEGAQQYMDFFLGDDDLSAVHPTARNALRKKFPNGRKGGKLLDLSFHVKNTVNRTDTTWISTAVKEGGGGRERGYMYKITMELREYQRSGGKWIPFDPGKPRTQVNQQILVGGTKENPFIAMNHGGSEDLREVSFFTSIPMRFIEEVRLPS
ncbi:RHS repeat-associated core domain-containing protein [Paraburkholderia phenazinium]|uniref:RHS repeat-associated core domain-containing protein n=1 Tax=Paraburkholderia phenazinium TaxID=60549 RepID=A0A1N6KXC8_9BURK|nr:RHS repeat-associated core domain-containing protein [Paraburkholderia phenazinium]SIO61179.1 RHS repeat-associated core domain-containing protein [Paraburkholderia phenazinium]